MYDFGCQNLAFRCFSSTFGSMFEGVLSDGPLGVVGPVDDVEEDEGQGEQLPWPLVRPEKRMILSSRALVERIIILLF